MASSSHSLNKHTGERNQTWLMTIQTSVSNHISDHNLPRIIQRVIIAQVKHNDDGWKQKTNCFCTIHSKRMLSIVCFITLSSSVVCGCNTSKSFLTCCVPPAKGKRSMIEGWHHTNDLKTHKTHNCKLKGTPRTSNLSISKSTPIVALYVLSNESLQNLHVRNINNYS